MSDGSSAEKAGLIRITEVSCLRCRQLVEVDVPTAWTVNVLHSRRPWLTTVVDLTCPARWNVYAPHPPLEVPDE